ncbi:hypothetical protein AB1L30_17025 [Bremerella sp. JC817]|uniref:hypothetical protein n=1 Tax=Bremerella sp. JC817 TaxID=3231756 RepID=UPI00345B18CA
MRALATACLVLLLGANLAFAQAPPRADFERIVTIDSPAATADFEKIEQLASELLTAQVELDFAKTPLLQAVEEIARQTKIPIEIHQQSLEDHGISLDTPVTLKQPKLSAASALRLLLRPEHLSYTITPEHVKVFGIEVEGHHRLIPKFYNLSSLVPDPKRDFNSLRHVIVDTIQPERWSDLGGPQTIEQYPGGMFVYAPVAEQQSVEALLGVLRQAKSLRDDAYATASLPVSPSSQQQTELEKRLENTRISIDAQRLPLAEVVQQISVESQIPIEIDTLELQNMGLTRNVAVNLQLKNFSVRHILNMLTRQHRLDWICDRDIVIISSPEDVEANLQTRVYPIRDLIWHGLAPRDVELLTMITDAANKKDDNPWAILACPSMPSIPSTDNVGDTIQEFVAPESWDELGGPGSLRLYAKADCLVVSQTAEVHAEVASFLQYLRRQQKPEDREELRARLQAELDEMITVVFDLTNDDDPKPQRSTAEIDLLSRRATFRIDPESWKRNGAYVDVTSRGLVVFNKRSVVQELYRYLVTQRALPKITTAEETEASAPAEPEISGEPMPGGIY